MKAAFESQLFLKGNKTGIPWVAHNLIKEFAKDPEFQCRCDYFTRGYSEEKLDEVRSYRADGVAMNPCGWFNDVWYKLLWPVFRIPYSWFFGGDRDVTLFFNYIIPTGVRGKKVAILHDMSYLACPETVSRKTRNWLKLTLKGSCRRADAIVAVSEFSKREAVRYLGIEPDKITVMPLGVDFRRFRPDYPEESIRQVKRSHGIEGEYFLYLGTLEPRKNIEHLIEAYARLREREEACPALVIAGGKGWLYDKIFERVHDLGLEKTVIFTGYVDGTQVPLLMSGALAFVFPSLYEGFGMPPAEAMAVGTPVIASGAASLPEVVGDAGILVDPHDVEGLAEAMRELAADPAKREELRRAGFRRIREYTWNRSADVLKKLYRKLLA